MKTDPRNAGEKTQETDKTTSTPLQRVGHVGLSIINPFSDLGVIYRQGVQPTMGRLREAWALLNHQSVPSESLDWAQAVACSGRTIEQLNTTFTRIRLTWWCLMVIGGGLALVLSGLVLLAHGLPSGTLLRAVITILVLAGAGGLGFVKTLITTYRVWQLQERRVSESEGGTFKDFLTENHWGRQVLTLGAAR
ncbi:conjugal transfer protein TraX [Pseudomonas sp. MF6768]|jgi:hypothetical protein|uniref:conjugal transfer protein TraX n=1 Tax=Pseudomonas sp. MF6768 TaxID=2797532 RepID=UPI0018E8F5F1|nr:conjugal transfer protein TraX [Pseudomonas sp. MF6768]MBJ2242809.1 conjugal transfer protein TraX [Pseudomonas sp. MF6768]